MTIHDSIKQPAIYNAIACTCGTIFSPKNSKQKLCSWRCRFKAILARSANVGDCVEWPMQPGCNGYGQFTIDGWNTTSHVTAYRYFYGEIPAGMVVMHSCDNRMCINPDHLSLGTRSENIKDMWSKGRQRSASTLLRGDSHPNVRFTELGKADIRKNYNGLSFRKIADQLGCDKGVIGRIFKSSSDSGRKTELLAQAPAAK
jgi:hypothetical protein